MNDTTRRALLGAALAGPFGWTIAATADDPGKPPAAPAGAPARLSIEQLTERPRFASLALSPQARRFAAWLQRGDKDDLVVRAIGGGEPLRSLLTTDGEKVIAHWFGWLSEDRLAVCISKGRGVELLSVPVDGGPIVALIAPQVSATTSPPPADTSFIVAWPTQQWPELLVQLRGQTELHSPDVFAIDVASGQRRLVHKAQQGTRHWVVDASRRVRVGVHIDDEQVQVRLAEDDGMRWRTAWSYGRKDRDGPWPLGFGADPNRLYLSAVHEGRRAVFDVDLRDAALPRRLVLSHPTENLAGELVTDARSGAAVGIADLRHSTAGFWQDDYRALAAAIDRALPERRNQLLQWRDGGRRYLAASEAGDQPRQFFVGDRQSGELALLVDSRPQLAPEQLAAQRPASITARDGSVLRAALTVRRDLTATKTLPAVIVVRGPLFASDRFDARVQLLANRGLAVLELGARAPVAVQAERDLGGWRRWFDTGAQDVVDAAQWLAAQGIADPTRIGLYASQLQSQAALLAAAQAPERFRCVVSDRGITDLLQVAETTRGRRAEEWLEEWLASPRTGVERLQALSPRTHAAAVRAAVLLVSDDQRGSPLWRQAEAMADALRAGRAATVQRLELPAYREGNPIAFNRQYERAQLQAEESFLLEQLTLSPKSSSPTA